MKLSGRGEWVDSVLGEGWEGGLAVEGEATPSS